MNAKSRMLRRWIVVGALTAPLLMFSTGARAQEDEGFYGTWETNFGAMHIEQDGDRARGEYEQKDGRIHGEVNGTSFSGIWSQSYSAHRCFEERMGSQYWGRVQLRMNDRGDRFFGRWSYCNDDPGSAGEWHGERRHHRR